MVLISQMRPAQARVKGVWLMPLDFSPRRDRKQDLEVRVFIDTVTQ
jgi:hypothetical protein